MTQIYFLSWKNILFGFTDNKLSSQFVFCDTFTGFINKMLSS